MDCLLGQKRLIPMSSYISQATPYPAPYMYTCVGLRELLYISRVSQITEAEKSVIKLILFCVATGVVKLKSTRNLKDE